MPREQGRHLIFLRVRQGEAFLNVPAIIDLSHELCALPAVSFLALVVSVVWCSSLCPYWSSLFRQAEKGERESHMETHPRSAVA